MSKCWLGCGRDRLPHSEIELCGTCSARCYRYIAMLKGLSPRERASWFAQQDAVYKSKKLLCDSGLVVLSSKAQRREYAERDGVKVLNRMLMLVIKESTIIAAEQVQRQQQTKLLRTKASRGHRRRNFASTFLRLPSAAQSEARA
jgi:hypothetical protein